MKRAVPVTVQDRSKLSKNSSQYGTVVPHITVSGPRSGHSEPNGQEVSN